MPRAAPTDAADTFGHVSAPTVMHPICAGFSAKNRLPPIATRRFETYLLSSGFSDFHTAL
jgi:hypothetical protein